MTKMTKIVAKGAPFVQAELDRLKQLSHDRGEAASPRALVHVRLCGRPDVLFCAAACALVCVGVPAGLELVLFWSPNSVAATMPRCASVSAALPARVGVWVRVRGCVRGATVMMPR
eukprot:m51a1_g13462 hypothetical protein (116) ;mRNA; f:733-2895